MFFYLTSISFISTHSIRVEKYLFCHVIRQHFLHTRQDISRSSCTYVGIIMSYVTNDRSDALNRLINVQKVKCNDEAMKTSTQTKPYEMVLIDSKLIYRLKKPTKNKDKLNSFCRKHVWYRYNIAIVLDYWNLSFFIFTNRVISIINIYPIHMLKKYTFISFQTFFLVKLEDHCIHLMPF